MEQKTVDFSMFDKLLMLPLFQGLSKDELTEMLEHTKWHFLKLKAGEVIAQKEDRCKELIFVLNGTVASKRVYEAKHLEWFEFYEPMTVIEPISLFGIKTSYNSNYYTHTEASILKISKDYIFGFFTQYPVFQLNYMNITCSRAQALKQRSLHVFENSNEHKVKAFFLAMSEREKGLKILLTNATKLSLILKLTKNQVVGILRDMQQQELIVIKKDRIIIPDIKKLK
ncbi:MAG: Crp/Fnr family transcriptional regulator [Bacteroidaceae bacterium]|nr:Crp/Fnr family transcriptional regulator [Bacteroidaceae bacterium]